MRTRFCAFLPPLLAAPLAVAQGVLINEVDADTANNDNMEFVELFDGGAGNTPLDGLVLVFFDGSDDRSYRIGTPTGDLNALDLDGYATDSNGYFVIGSAGVPSVAIVISNDEIQNGADAVALYTADATAFPHNTPVTTVNLVDALVYDTNDVDDAGLLVLLNPGQPQVNESELGNLNTFSNQRCASGAGGARNSASYTQGPSTPGAPPPFVPSAEFGGSPTSGTAPLMASFSDLSCGNVTSWSWDFGDGATSTLRNPAHTYSASGSYTVALTVTGPGGTDTETKTDYVTVAAAQPAAEFSADPTSGVAPLTTSFSDLSSGQITSWSWDFGDGGTSTLQSPGHTYSASGSYTVALTVTGPGGTDTETKVDYISVALSQPVAEFSADPTSGAAPLTTSFSDLSAGGITSWSWDFGDGGTSTLQNPGHTYSASGSYTVALTVTGPGGTDTETKIDYVAVAAAQPVAEFSANPTTGVAPLTTSFSDLSSGQITSWSWDFGDGGTSTLQNPGHTYSASGSYTVALTVTGPGGTDTRTRLDYIGVTPTGPPNVLIIIADDVGVDRIGAYGEHPDPGRTPNIDALAAQGVVFRNCWANPLCSPTRATILTGRYSFRTGVGTALQETGMGTPLSLGELTLPEALPGYATALLGKWHLGHYPLHPNDSGFGHFAGSLYNLDRLATGASYSLWTKTIDGSQMVTSEYATTDTADETIDAIETLAEPWFVVCSFNAAHTPIHAPPSQLHSYALSGDPLANAPLFTRAMIEAMDTEIGRVLAATPSSATVIFVGDNGTAGISADPPTQSGRSKGTVFEGGVRVPLIVSGPGVAQGECTAITNTTDLFATVVELGGGSATAEDSISLVPYLADPARAPLRERVFAEKYGNLFHLRAVREARYKLIQDETLTTYEEHLYDLEVDPLEQTNLLRGQLTPEQDEAYRRLTCTMPLPLDAQAYCPAVPNSTGAPATMGLSGSSRVATGVLCLAAADMPPGVNGYFIASPSQGFVPTPGGSAGNLCMGPGFRRFSSDIRLVDTQGTFALEIDPGALPVHPPTAILSGETWHFQAWFRDPLPTTTSNFTDASALTFQ